MIRGRLWVLNQKKLVEQVGLQDLCAEFGDVPSSAPPLIAWVDKLRSTIDRARY